MAESTAGPWEVRPDRGNPDRGWVEIHGPKRATIVQCHDFTRRSGGETEYHSGVLIREGDIPLIVAAPAYSLAWSLVPDEIKQRIFDALHKPGTEWVEAAIAGAEGGAN